MSKQAFDNLLAQLDSEEREKIYAMAAAYGLTFDDPSWIPFALTQATLDVLKTEIDQAAHAIQDATDHALRKINARAQAASDQARTVIERQSETLAKLSQSLDAIEKRTLTHYQASLAELAGAHLKTFIKDGAHGVVNNVTQRLTGERGVLTLSLAEHVRNLEQARQRFSNSIDEAVAQVGTAANTVVGSTRRRIVHLLWGAVGAVATCAIVAIGLMLSVSHHEAASNADLIRAYVAQRDELLRQVNGAKQLLAVQRTGGVSLRYYGRDLYLLAPGGFGEPARCGDGGLRGWLQPGGTPCLLIGKASENGR